MKLLARTTLVGGIGTALVYAVVTTFVLWVWMKVFSPAETLLLPLPLAAGIGIGGVIFESIFPTSTTFGVWEVIGEALGYTIALVILLGGPAADILYAFISLCVLVQIGQYFRVLQLKKRGYTPANQKQ